MKGANMKIKIPVIFVIFGGVTAQPVVDSVNTIKNKLLTRYALVMVYWKLLLKLFSSLPENRTGKPGLYKID